MVVGVVDEVGGGVRDGGAVAVGVAVAGGRSNSSVWAEVSSTETKRISRSCKRCWTDNNKLSCARRTQWPRAMLDHPVRIFGQRLFAKFTQQFASAVEVALGDEFAQSLAGGLEQ